MEGKLGKAISELENNYGNKNSDFFLDVNFFGPKNIFGDFLGPIFFPNPKSKISIWVRKTFLVQKIAENIFRSKKNHIEKKYFF